jgi:hypothetical protein
MVHDTPARQQARKIRKDARRIAREAKTLAGFEGPLESEAKTRLKKAKELNDMARDLQTRARLEDLTVRQNPITKQTRKGKRTYYRWVCSWQEGDKTITKYLGSCKRTSQTEALQKARKMKTGALGM